MTTFILSEDEKTGRVILDGQAHGPFICSIEAEETDDKSAWCVAREKVKEKNFYHVQNFGWLRIKKQEAA